MSPTQEDQTTAVTTETSQVATRTTPSAPTRNGDQDNTDSTQSRLEKIGCTTDTPEPHQNIEDFVCNSRYAIQSSTSVATEKGKLVPGNVNQESVANHSTQSTELSDVTEKAVDDVKARQMIEFGLDTFLQY